MGNAIGFLPRAEYIRGTTPVVRGRITLKSGQPLILNGASATLYVKNSLADADADAIICKAMTISEPENGRVQVLLSTTDTDRIGEFFAEVKIVFGGTGVVEKVQFTLVFNPTTVL